MVAHSGPRTQGVRFRAPVEDHAFAPSFVVSIDKALHLKEFRSGFGRVTFAISTFQEHRSSTPCRVHVSTHSPSSAVHKSLKSLSAKLIPLLFDVVLYVRRKPSLGPFAKVYDIVLINCNPYLDALGCPSIVHPQAPNIHPLAALRPPLMALLRTARREGMSYVGGLNQGNEDQVRLTMRCALDDHLLVSCRPDFPTCNSRSAPRECSPRHLRILPSGAL